MSPEQLFGQLELNGRSVIADLEAGIGTALRFQPGMADVMVVVADPSVKSLEVAEIVAGIARRRMIHILVAANRVGTPEDEQVIRDRLGDHEIVVIPLDPVVAEADRRGMAPIDMDASSPAVAAIGRLAAALAS